MHDVLACIVYERPSARNYGSSSLKQRGLLSVADRAGRPVVAHNANPDYELAILDVRGRVVAVEPIGHVRDGVGCDGVTDGAGYNRDLFVQWTDANHDGCDTRCEVLKRQHQPALPGLPNGGWLSPYDGCTTSDSSELDIDLVVPLHEAWLSGASSWDGATRTAFANDLDSPELLAVTAAANRSKGDKDPAEWQPPAHGDWCTYARGWVAVKAKWHLTGGPSEVAALRNMLNGCPT